MCPEQEFWGQFCETSVNILGLGEALVAVQTLKKFGLERGLSNHHTLCFGIPTDANRLHGTSVPQFHSIH
jgi:hypothetical protein